MKTITANDLKTRGVASIDAALVDQDEAIISVRGKDRYVIMDLEAYNRLRICELEAALCQAKREIAEGQGVEESADAHLARLLLK
jgi:PHD/YefM family antitoxin component YafN of YafNO toxin-antitoxin module